MHARPVFIASLLFVGACASCPSVWSDVAGKLEDIFGGCNSYARQAIRLPFHDCFAGACDGSIILSDECTARSENARLVPICGTLGNIANQYQVGVADLIQVAAAVGVAACPPGPTITVKVGRKDTEQANPSGNIPSGLSTATQLVSLFQSKSFSVAELVALTGSHSAGVDRNGTGLDTTITKLDSTTYYAEVADDKAQSIIPSDRSLAGDEVTRGDWQRYAQSQSRWNEDFAKGMEKMALMGVDDADNLVDCTSTIFGS